MPLKLPSLVCNASAKFKDLLAKKEELMNSLKNAINNGIEAIKAKAKELDDKLKAAIPKPPESLRNELNKLKAQIPDLNNPDPTLLGQLAAKWNKAVGDLQAFLNNPCAAPNTKMQEGKPPVDKPDQTPEPSGMPEEIEEPPQRWGEAIVNLNRPKFKSAPKTAPEIVKEYETKVLKVIEEDEFIQNAIDARKDYAKRLSKLKKSKEGKEAKKTVEDYLKNRPKSDASKAALYREAINALSHNEKAVEYLEYILTLQDLENVLNYGNNILPLELERGFVIGENKNIILNRVNERFQGDFLIPEIAKARGYSLKSTFVMAEKPFNGIAFSSQIWSLFENNKNIVLDVNMIKDNVEAFAPEKKEEDLLA